MVLQRTRRQLSLGNSSEIRVLGQPCPGACQPGRLIDACVEGLGRSVRQQYRSGGPITSLMLAHALLHTSLSHDVVLWRVLPPFSSCSNHQGFSTSTAFGAGSPGKEDMVTCVPSLHAASSARASSARAASTLKSCSSKTRLRGGGLPKSMLLTVARWVWRQTDRIHAAEAPRARRSDCRALARICVARRGF